MKRNARWPDRTPEGETILEVAIRRRDKGLFDFVLQNQHKRYRSQTKLVRYLLTSVASRIV
jgi:hypothetical protein